MVVHPLLNLFLKHLSQNSTGINPRHRLYHLSLLPSGPDEVHAFLLHGDQSEYQSHPSLTQPEKFLYSVFSFFSR